MAREIKRIGLAAEGAGVAVDPADCAAHLLDHWKQAAAGLVHIDEVRKHDMRPGLDVRLGQEGVVEGMAVAPGAAVNEHEDRRVRPLGTEDMKLLDVGRPISGRLRSSQDLERQFAGGPATLRQGALIERVDGLVVGVVELLLVHVEPNDRSLDMRRRRAALRQSAVGAECERSRGRGRAGDQRAAAYSEV